MANIGQINNQSSRWAAIFKVVSIYLLTLVLLIFLFNFNKNSNAAVSDPIVEHFEEVKKDTAILKAMLSYVDSIASLTKKIIDLDKENRDDPGSKKGEIDRFNAQIKTYYEKLTQKTADSGLKAGQNSVDNIYDVLLYAKEKLIDCREGIVASNASAQLSLEAAEDQMEESAGSMQDQLQAKIDDQEDQLDDKEREIDRLNSRLEALENINNAIEQRKNTILAKVKEIRQYIETEKSNAGTIPKWKTVVEQTEIKVNALENFIEQ